MFNERGKPTFCMLNCPIDFFSKIIKQLISCIFTANSILFRKSFLVQVALFQRIGQMIESMNKLHSNQIRRKYDGNMERRFTRRSSEKHRKFLLEPIQPLCKFFYLLTYPYRVKPITFLSNLKDNQHSHRRRNEVSGNV